MNLDSQIKPDWYLKLAAPPFSDSGLSKQLMLKIEQKVQVMQHKRSARIKLLWISSLGITAMIAIILLTQVIVPWGQTPKANVTIDSTAAGDSQKWKNNLQYFLGNKHLLSLFPDPHLMAGAPFNYKLVFHDPAVYSNEAMVHIIAVNTETGEKVTSYNNNNALVSAKFVTFTLDIPAEGLWRFDVYLNDQLYGNIELNFPDPWEVSPFFRSGVYMMHGEEGVLGFIDAGFVAGKRNKYMWHFWGSEGDLQGEFKVVAVQKGSAEKLNIFSAKGLGGKHNGADAHVPSSMMLPSQGLWRLMAYIDNRPFGSVVVEVK